MKTFMTGLLNGRITRWSMSVGLGVLLVWALPAIAGVKQHVEVVAWWPSPLAVDLGEWSVTPSGHVRAEGMKQVEILVSENALLTGRFTMESDANGNAELTKVVSSGRGVIEVGTWDFTQTDPEIGGPVFVPSPTGGRWVVKLEAKGSYAALSFEGQFVGFGVAGEVEGLQFVLAGYWEGFQGGYSGEVLDPHAQK